jgi:tetratricopeptide (TPR) repeat protein
MMLSGYSALEPIGVTATPDGADGMVTLTQILEADDNPIEGLLKINATPWMEDLLSRFLQMDPERDVILYEFFIECGSSQIQSWFFWLEPAQTVQLRKFERALSDCKDRFTSAGFSLVWRSQQVKVPLHEVLAKRITALNNEQIATRIGRNLMQLLPHEYVDEKNVTRAMELARIAFIISPSRATPEANNVGYLYMANGDFDEAKLWFQAGAQYSIDEDARQLLEYNFGVLCALSGEIEAARQHLNRAKQHMPISEASCAYQLYLDEEKLAYREVFDPRSIGDLATEALDAISQM